MRERPDLVFACLGGGAQGVFSAGVLAALEARGLARRVKKVYGSSCGALTGALFLAGKIRRASPAYVEALATGGVYNARRLASLPRLLAKHGFTKRVMEEWPGILDIDRLHQRLHPFLTPTIRSWGGRLALLLGDPRSGTVAYEEAGREGLEKLLAAVAAIPYYPRPVRVSGRSLVDGAVFATMDAARIIKEAGSDWLIILHNESVERGAGQRCKDLAEGLFFLLIGQRTIGSRVLKKLSRHRKELRLLEERGRVIHVAPRSLFGVTAFTRSRSRLQKLYEHGRIVGKELSLLLEELNSPASRRREG